MHTLRVGNNQLLRFFYMIQQKPPSKKKTIIMVAVMCVMFSGMAWMLFGSSPSSDTFIPAETSEQSFSPMNTKLDKNLFQDPLFDVLVPQTGVLPIDPTRIGRPNPFVPIAVKNKKQ